MSNPILKSVCRAMDRIAPLRLAESWDNVGLLLESPVLNPAKKRVLLTIDLTTAVLDEAIGQDASVIVAYHPPIFRGLKALTLGSPLQSSLLRCAAHGISVYSPHSALDAVWGGVNDWLAEGVLRGRGESGAVSSLVGEKVSVDGVVEGGEGRLVTLHAAISMGVLESRIKEHLGLGQIQVGYAACSEAGSAAPVRTVAVCAGSGGSMLGGKDADVYLTGEMSHHEVLAAVAAGTHVILCGHDNTERGYLPGLASRLRHELAHDAETAGVEVMVSEKDGHPLRIV